MKRPDQFTRASWNRVTIADVHDASALANVGMYRRMPSQWLFADLATPMADVDEADPIALVFVENWHNTDDQVQLRARIENVCAARIMAETDVAMQALDDACAVYQ